MRPDATVGEALEFARGWIDRQREEGRVAPLALAAVGAAVLLVLATTLVATLCALAVFLARTLWGGPVLVPLVLGAILVVIAIRWPRR